MNDKNCRNSNIKKGLSVRGSACAYRNMGHPRWVPLQIAMTYTQSKTSTYNSADGCFLSHIKLSYFLTFHIHVFLFPYNIHFKTWNSRLNATQINSNTLKTINIFQLPPESRHYHDCHLVFFCPGSFRLDICGQPQGASTSYHTWRFSPQVEITIDEWVHPFYISSFGS